jgi:hypothetical protein
VDGKLVPLPLLSLHDIFLFQALAEALTTSKGMVGRRLLSCSDFWPVEGLCNEIVKGLNAAWSTTVKVANDAAKLAEQAATQVLNEVKHAAKLAEQAATKVLNDVKHAAKLAEQAATKVLNDVKDAAEEAAKTATKFVEDIGNAFSELGDEIQCATPPLPPKGRSAVVACQ